MKAFPLHTPTKQTEFISDTLGTSLQCLDQCVAGSPQEVGEDEPEHSEVGQWRHERPDVSESRIRVLGLEVDGADDAQDAEVVGDATRGTCPLRPI
jgi:hypothetical protein